MPKHGTVVIVGNLEDRPVVVLRGAFMMCEIRLPSSEAYTRAELEACLHFIDRGQVDVQLHGSMALTQARAAHALVESGRVHGRVVLHT